MTASTDVPEAIRPRRNGPNGWLAVLMPLVAVALAIGGGLVAWGQMSGRLDSVERRAEAAAASQSKAEVALSIARANAETAKANAEAAKANRDAINTAVMAIRGEISTLAKEVGQLTGEVRAMRDAQRRYQRETERGP